MSMQSPEKSEKVEDTASALSLSITSDLEGVDMSELSTDKVRIGVPFSPLAQQKEAEVKARMDADCNCVSLSRVGTAVAGSVANDGFGDLEVFSADSESVMIPIDNTRFSSTLEVPTFFDEDMVILKGGVGVGPCIASVQLEGDLQNVHERPQAPLSSEKLESFSEQFAYGNAIISSGCSLGGDTGRVSSSSRGNSVNSPERVSSAELLDKHASSGSAAIRKGAVQDLSEPPDEGQELRYRWGNSIERDALRGEGANGGSGRLKRVSKSAGTTKSTKSLPPIAPRNKTPPSELDLILQLDDPSSVLPARPLHDAKVDLQGAMRHSMLSGKKGKRAIHTAPAVSRSLQNLPPLSSSSLNEDAIIRTSQSAKVVTSIGIHKNI